MGIIYNPIVSFVKLSVLVFTLRFAGVQGIVRYTVWGVGVVNVSVMIAVFIVMILDCVPFNKNWDVSLNGYCVDPNAFAMASSTIAIVTDVVNLALPFYVFSNLRVSLRQKIGLFSVFSLGLL